MGPITRNRADVLVVGSGAAAFAAAITATKNGASVIMLEKADAVGGTTSRSGGGFWIPLNQWQKQAGYEDNREDALRYMARYSYPHLYNPNAQRYGIPQHEFELLEAHVDNGHRMVFDFDEWGALHSIMEINWTGKGQVDYQDHLPENKGIRGRSVYPRDEQGKMVVSGAELIRQLEAWARAHNVDIITQAEVSEILQDDKGRVNGLKAIIGGETHTFHANKGVVFGSGGYSHNAEYMLQFQRGPHYGGCSVPTNTGDFIRMGGAIGARIGNTAGAFRAQSMIESYLQNPGGSSNVFYLPGDSMILVNKYGKRVVDEKRNYTDRTMVHFVWDALRAEWTNMLTFMLFDERTANLWQGWPPFPLSGQTMPYLISASTLQELEKEIAQRLEKLAPFTGAFSLAPNFGKNLQETFQRFNQFAKTGVDEDFHRGETDYDREWTTFPPSLPGAEWPPKDSKNYTMYPLREEGPYYAIILAAGTLDTNGGPVINKNAQVLGWNNQPIEGLYGAGNCIASPTANAYWGGGSTIGPGLTFGYIAGNHITKK
ncbi:FAD-dependent oxidoreductase [Ruminococcaceae bacterium OttesenSCG-928-A16]|nr:FAD-dependent oxidoreductase [Ruminococcaceae bacterium OttesenSCG-928-A16]